MYFYYFLIISFLNNLNKLKSPFIHGCFVSSVVEIGQVVFGGADFFKFVNVFLLFCNYLPLEKSWPFIWTNLILLIQGYFVPSLVKLAQYYWRRRWNVKSLQIDGWTMHNTLSEKLNWAFTQVSYKCIWSLLSRCWLWVFHKRGGDEEYTWFLGGNLNNFQDNLKLNNEGGEHDLKALYWHAGQCILSWLSRFLYGLWVRVFILFKIIS